MHSTRRFRLFLLTPTLLVMPLLAACGGSSTASSTSTASTPTTSATAGSSSSRVTATESEYKIVLSSATVKPGTTTIVAVNAGSIPHSLAINGPGVAGKQTNGTIAPGASQTLTVTLQKGSYDLYCTVSGHKALGMDTKLTVQ